VVLDDRVLHVVARVQDARFHDGIAYAREADKVFLTMLSLDARTMEPAP
jgi:hypothetical protein